MAIKQTVNIDTSKYLGTDFAIDASRNPLNSILPKIEVLKVITRKVTDIDLSVPKGPAAEHVPLNEYETIVHATITETKQPELDGYNWLNIPEYTNLFKISCLQVMQTNERPGIIKFRGASEIEDFLLPGTADFRADGQKLDAAMQPIKSIVPFRTFEMAAARFLSSGRAANMILNGVKYADLKSELLYELRGLHFETYKEYTAFRNARWFSESQQRLRNRIRTNNNPDDPLFLDIREDMLGDCVDLIVRGCPVRENCIEPDGYSLNCKGDRPISFDGRIFPRNSIRYVTMNDGNRAGFVSSIDNQTDSKVEIQQISLDAAKATSEHNSVQTGYSNSYTGMIRRVDSETSFKIPIKFKFRYQSRGINFLSHHLFIDFDFFQMMDMFDSDIRESWHTLAADRSSWPVLSNQSTRIVSAIDGRKLDYVTKYYSAGELFRGPIVENIAGETVGMDENQNEIPLSEQRYLNSKVDFEDGPMESHFSFMVFGQALKVVGEHGIENWKVPLNPWGEREFQNVEPGMPPPPSDYERVVDEDAIIVDKRREIVDQPEEEVDYRDYESESSAAARRLSTSGIISRSPGSFSRRGPRKPSFTISKGDY